MKRMWSTCILLAVLAGFAMFNVAVAADAGFEIDQTVISMDAPVDLAADATALPEAPAMTNDPTYLSDSLEAVADESGFNQPTGQGVTPWRSGKRINANHSAYTAPRLFRMRV